ncbi:hypothetical protein D3C78_1759730 [compost metagenome]
MATIVFTHFQAVIVGRKPVIVVAVQRFDGKCRETVVDAVTAIRLMPGKNFPQWRDR